MTLEHYRSAWNRWCTQVIRKPRTWVVTCFTQHCMLVWHLSHPSCLSCPRNYFNAFLLVHPASLHLCVSHHTQSLRKWVCVRDKYAFLGLIHRTDLLLHWKQPVNHKAENIWWIVYMFHLCKYMQKGKECVSNFCNMLQVVKDFFKIWYQTSLRLCFFLSALSHIVLYLFREWLVM